MWVLYTTISMRRILIIVAVVIVLVGIGVAIYFYFFAKAPALTTTPGSLPVAGEGTAPGTSGATGEGGPSAPAPVSISPRLVKISAGPVVPGEAVINTQLATASSTEETVVNYLARESGNVFSYSTNTKTLRRISNKTLPGIESAAWLPDGSAAFVRYLSGAQFSTINTYALSASSSNSFFLSQNLADIAVSSAGILTLASGVNGSRPPPPRHHPYPSLPSPSPRDPHLFSREVEVSRVHQAVGSASGRRLPCRRWALLAYRRAEERPCRPREPLREVGARELCFRFGFADGVGRPGNRRDAPSASRDHRG